MYARGRGQAVLRRVLLFFTAVIVLSGLAMRLKKGGMQVEQVAQPTATPIAYAYDETIETRQVKLGGTAWYAVQTGIFTSAEAAQERAAAYTSRGAPGYMVRDGERYRVLIACYALEEDAKAVCDRLRDKQKMDVHLYAWQRDETLLKLTGMAGQLDVAEAGATLLDGAAARMRDKAVEIDRGECTGERALEAMDEIEKQLQLWRNVTIQRFRRPAPVLIEQLLGAADAWEKIYDQVKNTKTLTALSAEMKLGGMAMFDCLAQMQKALENS